MENKAAQMDKVYNPQAIEGELYKEWEETGAFVAHRVEGKQPFTIVMPPPNITGQLHMGHAMDGVLQDSLTRYHRMKGDPTLWLPGTDHASIATEVKIVEAMRKEGLDKHDVGRDHAHLPGGHAGGGVTVCVAPAVDGRVEDVVGGAAHLDDGGRASILNVVRGLSGGEHDVGAPTDELVGVLVAVVGT